MTHYFLSFIASIILLTSCNSEKKPTAIIPVNAIKEKVNTVVDNWHKAAAEANFETYFSLMTKDGIFIGTDATENWQNAAFRAFAKPYFDKGKAWSFTPLERNIYVSEDKNTVWFDELLDTQMKLCRGSGILTKESNSWKIAHYVLSIAIPNDQVKAVIDLKKPNDSLLIAKKSDKLTKIE